MITILGLIIVLTIKDDTLKEFIGETNRLLIIGIGMFFDFLITILGIAYGELFIIIFN